MTFSKFLFQSSEKTLLKHFILFSKPFQFEIWIVLSKWTVSEFFPFPHCNGRNSWVVTSPPQPQSVDAWASLCQGISKYFWWHTLSCEHDFSGKYYYDIFHNVFKTLLGRVCTWIKSSWIKVQFFTCPF